MVFGQNGSSGVFCVLDVEGSMRVDDGKAGAGRGVWVKGARGLGRCAAGCLRGVEKVGFVGC